MLPLRSWDLRDEYRAAAAAVITCVLITCVDHVTIHLPCHVTLVRGLWWRHHIPITVADSTNAAGAGSAEQKSTYVAQHQRPGSPAELGLCVTLKLLSSQCSYALPRFKYLCTDVHLNTLMDLAFHVLVVVVSYITSGGFSAYISD